VQEQGCLALLTLLAYGRSQVTAAKFGAVEVLVKALETFATNAAVKKHGRTILKNMSKNAEARKHSVELRLAAVLS